MTVKDLIAWLQTQEQEAVVQVVKHINEGGYEMQGGSAKVEDFTPSLTEFSDFRENPFVKPEHSFYKKCYLLLGEYNG